MPPRKRLSPPTRLLLISLLSLSLGAFATVMISIRCALLSPITTPPASLGWVKNPDGSHTAPAAYGLGLRWGDPRDNVTYDPVLNQWTPIVETPPVCRVGFPFLSMCWYNNPVRFNADGIRKPPINRLHGKLLTGLDPAKIGLGTVSPERRIPLYPILPGFLANTLLYAALAWALIGGYTRLQRLSRARKHCCAECGYPIGLSPLCTECGHPLPPPSQPTPTPTPLP